METGPPGVLVIAVVLCALYFLPTWIAGGRKHHNQYAIFASNLLLGWTFLGWVVALEHYPTKLNHLTGMVLRRG